MTGAGRIRPAALAHLFMAVLLGAVLVLGWLLVQGWAAVAAPA